MPNSPTRVFAVNGSGGAWTPLPATIRSTSAIICEDGLTPQGFSYLYNDGYQPYANTYTAPAGSVITLGGQGAEIGRPITTKGAAATVLAYVRSATATATSIRITELP